MFQVELHYMKTCAVSVHSNIDCHYLDDVHGINK